MFGNMRDSENGIGELLAAREVRASAGGIPNVSTPFHQKSISFVSGIRKFFHGIKRRIPFLNRASKPVYPIVKQVDFNNLRNRVSNFIDRNERLRYTHLKPNDPINNILYRTEQSFRKVLLSSDRFSQNEIFIAEITKDFFDEAKSYQRKLTYGYSIFEYDLNEIKSLSGNIEYNTYTEKLDYFNGIENLYGKSLAQSELNFRRLMYLDDLRSGRKRDPYLLNLP